MSAESTLDDDTRETLRELVRMVTRLQERVDALEDLHESIDFRNEGPPGEADIDEIWIAGYPIGKLVDSLKTGQSKLKGRVTNLETDAVDPSVLGIDVEGSLPIQTRTAERQQGRLKEAGNLANLYRATYVWENFLDRAIKEPGVFKLSSSQVANILESADGESFPTDRKTVGRVMDRLARNTAPGGETDDPEADENLVRYISGGGRSMLVADRDRWEALHDAQKDAIEGDTDLELTELGSTGVGADD